MGAEISPTQNEPEAWQGPCAADPQAWDLDLDQGDMLMWRRAILTCQQCPFIQACKAELFTQYPGKVGPSSMIWAGVAFSDSGRTLTTETLRRMGVEARNRRIAAARISMGRAA